MPPLQQRAPAPPQEEPAIDAGAANEDYFIKESKTTSPIETVGDACIETLNPEDILTLFKKRKAVTWLSRNGPEAVKEANKNVLVEIMGTMRRYNIKEEDYLEYERGEGEMID